MVKVKLLNKNCMDVQLPKCRLLLTDIPYEFVNRDSNGLRNLDKDKAVFKIKEEWKKQARKFGKHLF